MGRSEVRGDRDGEPHRLRNSFNLLETSTQVKPGLWFGSGKEFHSGRGSTARAVSCLRARVSESQRSLTIVAVFSLYTILVALELHIKGLLRNLFFPFSRPDLF